MVTFVDDPHIRISAAQFVRVGCHAHTGRRGAVAAQRAALCIPARVIAVSHPADLLVPCRIAITAGNPFAFNAAESCQWRCRHRLPPTFGAVWHSRLRGLLLAG